MRLLSIYQPLVQYKITTIKVHLSFTMPKKMNELETAVKGFQFQMFKLQKDKSKYDTLLFIFNKL